jgi:hypothetical protein
MIDPRLPIYDKEVATMYGFRTLYKKDRTAELAALKDFYSFLCKDYARIVKDDSLNPSFEVLEKKHSALIGNMSPNKRIDFIVWSAGKTFAADRKSQTRN